MQNETQYAVRVDKQLKGMSKLWFCNIQQVSIRGIPDRIGCINGKFFALELKRSAKAKRAPLQEFVIKKINDSGGFAEFIFPENHDEIMKELERYGHDKE